MKIEEHMENHGEEDRQTIVRQEDRQTTIRQEDRELRGDKIIIMAYGQYTPDEAKEHKPAVVFVDEENKVSRVTNYERHGLLKDME